MQFRKICYLFLLFTCVCLVMLSGCTTNHSSSSGANVTSTIQPATNTTSSTALLRDCPAAGTVRPVNLPTNMSAAQPAVFYVTAWGGVQSGFNPLDLIRYDLTTRKTATILSFTGNPVGFRPQFQLSPNKHWLLITDTWKINTTESSTGLLLLRTDGTQRQLLACFSSEIGLRAVHWLPDGQRITLTKEQYDQKQQAWFSTVEVLNLATGKSQTVLSGEYSPSLWLDNHRLIVERTSTTNHTDFYLLDINKGNHQRLTNLTPIASFPTWGNFVYGEIAASLDRSQLFISSFAQASTNSANCQGPTAQGPGTVKVSAITGASRHMIYSSQSLAILAISPVNSHTLLLYVENNTGDLSQNGLWKINTDGTGLTRLTTTNDQKCRDLGYWEWSPQIASNNQSYALVQTDSTKEYSQSIVVGSLSGDTPTTIATSASIQARAGFDRFLQLVGMA